jgi:hypothetical protein
VGQRWVYYPIVWISSALWGVQEKSHLGWGTLPHEALSSALFALPFSLGEKWPVVGHSPILHTHTHTRTRTRTRTRTHTKRFQGALEWGKVLVPSLWP